MLRALPVLAMILVPGVPETLRAQQQTTVTGGVSGRRSGQLEDIKGGASVMAVRPSNPVVRRRKRPPQPAAAPRRRESRAQPQPNVPPQTPDISDEVEEAIERGNAERDARRYDAAESAYRRAARLDPNEPRAYIGLGNVYFDQQRYPEAADAYRTAIRLEPSNSVLSRFYFEYGGEPEPGRRTWSQVNQVMWIEQYPSGHQTAFIVLGRTTVKGVNGYLVRKLAGDPQKTLVMDLFFEVFIPDPGGQDSWLMFRHFVDGQWLEWNYLANIKYLQ